MPLGFGIEVSTTTSAKLELVAGIRASTFVRADCTAQLQVLEKMVACGRIVVETDSSDVEFDEIAEAAEGEYDSEVDFIDDDEIDDGDSLDAHTSPGGSNGERLDFIPRFHEIKIVRGVNGKWSCIPPRNPTQGYRPKGYDTEAKLILDAIGKQFAFYEAVAKWLRNEGDDVLKSPAAFQANHVPMTRKGFCESIGFADKGQTNIHAYCQKCRLSWGHASLPLESLFS